MEKSDLKSVSKNSSISGILIRLYWFAFGHVTLVFFIISMFENKVTVLKSVFYFLFVGLLITSKYVDIRYFDGTNAEGDKPATMTDFKRFFSAVMTAYSVIFLILLFL